MNSETKAACTGPAWVYARQAPGAEGEVNTGPIPNLEATSNCQPVAN